MWLGPDRLTYKTTSSGGGAQSLTTITGYNTGVTITAPPAGKILKR
jgi:hypothetical protein